LKMIRQGKRISGAFYLHIFINSVKFSENLLVILTI
jgi:hypothetical protein